MAAISRLCMWSSLHRRIGRPLFGFLQEIMELKMLALAVILGSDQVGVLKDDCTNHDGGIIELIS